MSSIEPHPRSANDSFSKGEDARAQPTFDKTGAGTYVTSENEAASGSPVMGNEVLEHDAQTKGRWFQYIKTKQFWITLLLGQGTFTTSQL